MKCVHFYLVPLREAAPCPWSHGFWRKTGSVRDRRQGTGDRRQETGDRGKETGDGSRKKGAGDRRGGQGLKALVTAPADWIKVCPVIKVINFN